MLIEILSVCKKNETETVSWRQNELQERLEEEGFTLKGVKKTLLQSDAIRMALSSMAKSDNKPDIAIVTGALQTKDSASFKKYFVESVVAAERAENDPVPKDYWKQRNTALKNARARGASKQEIEELEKSFELQRKKVKIFSLGDFGNGYKGYAFICNGMRVAAVPKPELVGRSFESIAAIAAKRTTEVFESNQNEFPDGFSVQAYVPPKTGFVNRFIPMRGDSKKEIARKCVVIASVLVFLGALWALYYNLVFLSMQNAQLNGDIQRIAHDASDQDGTGAAVPSKGAGSRINWAELQKINKEIVGWIQLKGTQIDYPVLWHKGDDAEDQYYLNHNYQRDYDSYGCIFLDYRCTEGMSSKNIVLHGHHMNDGSMFGDLMEYGGTGGDLDFYKKHASVEFDTPEGGDCMYKIISVYKTNTLSAHGEFFNYMVGNFQNEKDFMNYVYNVRIRSLINCPVDVNEDDELLTLSTCSYEFTNFRTVVVARRVRIGEDSKVDVSKASLNKNAVWPEVYYSSYGGTRPTVTDFCTAYEKKQIDWYDGNYDFKDQRITTPTDGTTAGSTGSSSSGRTNGSTATTVLLHGVTFINYDGSFIKNEIVEDGKPATAPPDPVKPSDQYYDYVFKGWGLEFSSVTSDMVIAPIFEPVLKPEYVQ